MIAAASAPASLQGLSEEEARRRLLARGRQRRPTSSRSYLSIIRANVFNLPNIVLGILGIVTLVAGEAADALFLGIVAANALLGSVQEIRAKRALEKLSALVRPVAHVIRDGRQRELAVGDVVEGDLLRLQAGDQVTADGRVEESEVLRLDESILTGESDPVGRHRGDEVRSGSFVVEGAALVTVTAVGRASYAERMAGAARAFRHPNSPYQQGLNRLILGLLLVGIPAAVLLAITLVLRHTPFPEALQAVVAAVAGIVPEGLILLTSVAYVTGALKMSRRGILTQQLNALESLASANTLCLDKTGTLTEGRLRVVDLIPASGTSSDSLATLIGRFAASATVRNATLEALGEAYPATPEPTAGQVPFSSRWKWSAVGLAGATTFMGAPELFPLGPLAERATAETASGRRVLAIAGSPDPLQVPDAVERPPAGLHPLGLAVLSEQLRADAGETVRFFTEQQVELKVISGDAPSTVAAIADDVGIPSSGPPVDGRTLPEDDAGLEKLMVATSVVGRITPEGKRRVVSSLRESGRHVGMVGDGVNDVPALKESQVAIAQGSGSQMARTVADMVLVSGSFSAVPRLVAEGRQILRNLQRVSKLYATKCLFNAFLVLTIGLAPLAYPLLPRQLTLANFFTTGVTATVLALAPSSGEWRLRSFMREVGGFALRAAAALATGVGAAYLVATGLGFNTPAARTVATTALVGGFLVVVVMLEATATDRARWVGLLCLGLFLCYLVTISIPLAQRFFELEPTPQGLAIGVAGAAVTALMLLLLGIRRRPG